MRIFSREALYVLRHYWNCASGKWAVLVRSHRRWEQEGRLCETHFPSVVPFGARYLMARSSEKARNNGCSRKAGKMEGDTGAAGVVRRPPWRQPAKRSPVVSGMSSIRLPRERTFSLTTTRARTRRSSPWMAHYSGGQWIGAAVRTRGRKWSVLSNIWYYLKPTKTVVASFKIPGNPLNL